MKNSYVDVFNPSGAPLSKAADNILAPALPSVAVPQGGFFVPGSIPQQQSTMQLNDNSGGYQQQQQQDVSRECLERFKRLSDSVATRVHFISQIPRSKNM